LQQAIWNIPNNQYLFNNNHVEKNRFQQQPTIQNPQKTPQTKNKTQNTTSKNLWVRRAFNNNQRKKKNQANTETDAQIENSHKSKQGRQNF
jgi:hypothetical protein